MMQFMARAKTVDRKPLNLLIRGYFGRHNLFKVRSECSVEDAIGTDVMTINISYLFSDFLRLD